MMDKFKPIDLLEGFSPEESFACIEACEAVTDAIFGGDNEASAVVYSFLLGKALRNCKVTPEMAFGMVVSSIKNEQEGE